MATQPPVSPTASASRCASINRFISAVCIFCVRASVSKAAPAPALLVIVVPVGFQRESLRRGVAWHARPLNCGGCQRRQRRRTLGYVLEAPLSTPVARRARARILDR